jgi:hypothetical protein
VNSRTDCPFRYFASFSCKPAYAMRFAGLTIKVRKYLRNFSYSSMGSSFSILSSQVSAGYPLRYEAVRAIWSVGARGAPRVRRCNDYAVEKSRSSFRSFSENEGSLEDFMKLGVLRTSGSSIIEAARFDRTKVVPSIYIGYVGVSPASFISIARISFSCLFSLIRIISAACRSYIVGCTSCSSFCSSPSLIAVDAPALLVSGCNLLPVVALSLCWALRLVSGGAVAPRPVLRNARSARMLLEAYTERSVNQRLELLGLLFQAGSIEPRCTRHASYMRS